MNFTDHGREIAFLTWVSTGVLALMGFGLYNATKAGVAFDPAAYLVVITLVIGVIKEGRLSRSVDRMGQSLAEAQPPTTSGSPSGTQDDPLHVAGAAPGEPPVRTKPAGGTK